MNDFDTSEIEQKFSEYAEIMQELEAIRAELPELSRLEKRAEECKKEIQDWAKGTGKDFAAEGYQVVLSFRESWDTKKLPGFAVAHPELNALKSVTTVATVKRAR